MVTPMPTTLVVGDATWLAHTIPKRKRKRAKPKPAKAQGEYWPVMFVGGPQHGRVHAVARDILRIKMPGETPTELVDYGIYKRRGDEPDMCFAIIDGLCRDELYPAVQEAIEADVGQPGYDEWSEGAFGPGTLTAVHGYAAFCEN